MSGIILLRTNFFLLDFSFSFPRRKHRARPGVEFNFYCTYPKRVYRFLHSTSTAFLFCPVFFFINHCKSQFPAVRFIFLKSARISSCVDAFYRVPCVGDFFPHRSALHIFIFNFLCKTKTFFISCQLSIFPFSQSFDFLVRTKVTIYFFPFFFFFLAFA